MRKQTRRDHAFHLGQTVFEPGLGACRIAGVKSDGTLQIIDGKGAKYAVKPREVRVFE
jgi:hypothetical protein